MTHKSKDESALATATLRAEKTPPVQNIARKLKSNPESNSHALPHSTFPCFFFDRPRAFIRPFVIGIIHTIEITSTKTVTAKYK